MNKRCFNFFPSLISLLIGFSLAYPESILRVLDRSTQAPVPGVEVVLVDVLVTLKTDRRGRVRIKDEYISNGKIKVTIFSSRIEYMEKTLSFDPEQETTIYVSMKERNIKETDPVLVKAQNQGPSQRNFSKNEIKQNLQINRNDAIKTLQSQPGVSHSGDSTDASLIIQGGSGEEWIGFLDHVFLVAPTRWGGAVSIFNPTVIENIGFFTAGYPAAYGNALSGILDVSLLTPDKSKWHFYGAIDSGAEFIAHGPLGKNKNAGMLLQVRRTWVELLQRLFPRLFLRSGERGIQQAPFILDGILKFHFDLSPESQIKFLFYGSWEGLDVDTDKLANQLRNPNLDEGERSNFKYTQYNFITSLTHDYYFRGENRLNTTFAFTPRDNRYSQNDDGSRSLDDKVIYYPFQFSMNYTHSSIANHDFRVGGMAYLNTWEVDIDQRWYFITDDNTYTFDDREIAENRTTHLYQMFFSHDWRPVDHFLMQYGLHVNYGTTANEFFVAPRLSFEVYPSSQAALHLRAGLYNAHELRGYWLAFNPNLKSQKSVHTTLGGKFRVKWFNFSAETFYKYYWDLVELRFDDIYQNNSLRHVAGFSLYLQKAPAEGDIFNAYLSYTYQRAWQRTLSRDPLSPDEFGYSLRSTFPELNRFYRPQYLREHTLSVFAQVTPFRKVKSRLSPRKAYWIRNQYLAFEFGILSEKTETAAVSVTKALNSEGEEKFLVNYGTYNNATAPPLIKFNIKYAIPFSKHFDLFVSFINILNYRNVIFYQYTVADEFIDGDASPRREPYPGNVDRVANIDTEFTVRGGFHIRY